jgi:hypothetical protein
MIMVLSLICQVLADSAAPNRAVQLIYIGAVVLAFSVVTLGIGLLRGANAG